MPTPLGSFYIYVTLIIIMIIIFCVSIANLVYFSDEYNNDLTDLTTVTVENLIIFNFVIMITFLISILIVGYMIMSPQDTTIKKENINLDLPSKIEILSNEVHELRDDIKLIKNNNNYNNN